MSPAAVPPPPQAGRPAQLITCPKCQAPMYVFMPALRIQNWADVSTIVVPHENPQSCPKCGANYICTIAGFNQAGAMEFAWREIDFQNRPIVAPTSEQRKVVEKSKIIV